MSVQTPAKFPWIPVARELPEVGEPVLIAAPDEFNSVGTGYYDGHHWHALPPAP